VRSMASLLPTLPSTSTHMRMHHTHSHTLPISLDTVSESLLVKLATNPACHRLYCPVASAAAAQNSPAAPEPQTLFCVFRGGMRLGRLARVEVDVHARPHAGFATVYNTHAHVCKHVQTKSDAQADVSCSAPCAPHSVPAISLAAARTGPRRPDRASAMPSRCFCSSLTFVTWGMACAGRT